MKLIITIDVEEDNWARYSSYDNPVENVKRIPLLQNIFDTHGVKPTYLVTYPVLSNPDSVRIIKQILDEGKCEVGLHCHPWNTPPIIDHLEIRDHETMLCNLPEELIFEKMSVIYKRVSDNFGITPVSSRTGRWGFSPAVARSLVRLGCRVDTSITPYVNWSSYHGPDFTSLSPEPYRFHPDSIFSHDPNGALLEVPATVGFTQSNFKRAQRIISALDNRMGRLFRLKGLLYRAGIVNKVWLSPELSDAATMIKLAKRIQQNGFDVLNMSFHSNSLLSGTGPFVRTEDSERKFLTRIEGFLRFAAESGYENITLEKCTTLYNTI